MASKGLLLTVALVIVFMALATGAALAAVRSSHMPRWTMASSGTSSRVGLTLRGSLGQSFTGRQQGGNRAAVAGYWAGVLPAEDAPVAHSVMLPLVLH